MSDAVIADIARALAGALKKRAHDRRLRAEADINLPTIPDESVENDPSAT
jgi:hypothetical protein